MHLSIEAAKTTADYPKFAIRCPNCRKHGVFEKLEADLYLSILNRNSSYAGQRRCPDPACHAHVFIVGSGNGHVLVAYPPERIDFDPSGIPPQVLRTLEEAISCHAVAAYVAAAIMVRKTLEELCAERGAAGPNLKQRIVALGSQVILPRELLDAIDDLRLLGNDAAHIESNTYNAVGKDEVEVGIEVAKEVLKAVYQYSELLQRIRALKKES